MSIQLKIAGSLIVIALIVVLLFSSPGAFFSTGVSFIDTELHGSSDSGQFVRTRMDLADPQQVGRIIEQTEWTGYQYDWEEFKQMLGAETLAAWSCYHPSSSRVVWFLIIQSKDTTSFHPPPVCYQSLGYIIEEESTIDIPVPGEGWAMEGVFEFSDDPHIYGGSVRVKELIVARKVGSNQMDRRLVLYCYLKEERTAYPSTITMIRVSAIIPSSDSYEDVLTLEKKLITDFFPLMFEPREGGRTLSRWLFDEWGPMGGLVIAVMILIPLGFMVYSIVCHSRKKRVEGLEHS